MERGEPVDGGTWRACRPRIVIAGTHSGVGKTTVTLAVMAALRRRGLRVQGFKVGPDYIDPTYHRAVTGRPSRNLDSWMGSPDIVREVFERASRDADISVIEGVMGMYDGRSAASDEGSTVDIARLLDAPVVLVADVSGLARSAAALVLGYLRMAPDVRVEGVIANGIASSGHLALVREAVESACGVPVLGGVPRDPEVRLPERHLGLVPSLERGELGPLFERLACLAEERLDLDLFIRMAMASPPPSPAVRIFPRRTGQVHCTIAVARDAAFHFYYQENLDLLESYGAQLVFFSPLAGETIPDEADALYIGGGFPEEFAVDLTRNTRFLKDLHRICAEGHPVLAECGGFMVLTQSITDRSGVEHAMAGVLPARVRMQERLAALGYRDIALHVDNVIGPAGMRLRGHEFHYSTVEWLESQTPAYEVRGLHGAWQEGAVIGNTVAGYTHLYFPSQPEVARRFVEAARRWRMRRDDGTDT